MGSKKCPDLNRVLQRLVLFSMFLPLVVVSVTAIGIVGLRGEQAIKKELRQRAQSMAWMVEQHLEQATNSMDAVARVAQTAPSQLQAVMQGIWEACGCFDTLSHLDPSGRIKSLVPFDPGSHGRDMSNQPYFKQNKNNNLTISHPFISIHTGKSTVYLVRKLSQGGFVVGELNLEALQNKITAKKHAMDKGSVFLMDQSGTLLAHAGPSPAGQKNTLKSPKLYPGEDSSETTLMYEYGPKSVLGSAVRVEQTDWVAVVQVPLFTALSSFIWALALTLPVALGVWPVLSWNLRKQLNQRIVTPLVALNRGAGALANADFDQSRAMASMPAAFSELTALADSFQRMTDALEVRQSALQESEKGYRTLFEGLPVSLFRSTPAGQFLYVNPALVRMMGFPDQETLIKTNSKNIYPNPVEREQWRSLAERDGIVRDFEVQMQRFDGTIISVWLTCRTVWDSEGQVLFYEGNFEDVTERKKLEAQVRQSQKMEAIGQLAGGVAHDFNNMLNVIIGYAELTLMDLDDDNPMCGRIKGIHKAGMRSMELTRQLLIFARKQIINPKAIDLNTTLQGMLSLLERLIGENIDLLWIPGADLWPVKMDPSQVDQILVNLCVNARDAVNGPGKITIETQNIEFDAGYCTEHEGFIPGRYVMLAVSDNGCGMDKQTMDKIFEPFYTTKGQGQGTGMGLSTVYGIVKQNTGFINVYSEQGHGTTFKIYLRRHDAAGINDIMETRPVVPLLTGYDTILLVEDESTALEMTQTMLEKFGYTVFASSSPVEAMHIAEKHSDKISLLITDVVMPEMTGRDLADNLTARYPKLKCLFMSGYTSNVIVHQGVLDDDVNFIQKPFSSRELATRVREALNS
nr:ATP-binding protein [uncultured Desulfobacter sp.]